jgi:iron complex outermembrane receptor protein
MMISSHKKPILLSLMILPLLCLAGTTASAYQEQGATILPNGAAHQEQGVTATATGANARAVAGQEQQGAGRVVGSVLLENGEAVHAAIVLILETRLSTTTHSDGSFEIDNVPPGTYQIMAQRQGLGTVFEPIVVDPGETTEIDFTLAFVSINEQITVTATVGHESTVFDTFNAVTSLDAVDIANNVSGTLGEVLANEPGIAKRSFGPGNARPIIRGFDGDRVLMMEDGVRTGDLSSQSGDHGVTTDPAALDRVEVVKGPATLLYGSNAIGGVVNAITPHEAHRANPHEGLIASVTADTGSANAQLGGNGSFQFSSDPWLFWAGGGSRRTGNYETPEGPIENSATDLSNGRFGLSYSEAGAYVSAGYTIEDGTFGVPFAGEFEHGGHDHDGVDGHGEEVFIKLDQRRRSLRLDGGAQDLTNSVIEGLRLTFNYLDWHHEEVEVQGSERNVGTVFDNKTYVARADFDQHGSERFHGEFGLWGLYRDYEVIGHEALSPPTTQAGLAGFIYEELHIGEAVRLQFGARVEHNAYDPDPREETHEQGHEQSTLAADNTDAGLEPPVVRPRSFTGLSGSAGIHFTLPSGHAVVANLTHSYRAPALEELYNFGPHIGNLTFEIGNPDLDNEISNGIDVSFRHRSERALGEINFFYYGLGDFIFADLTDQVVDGLFVARFLQGDARFTGFDAEIDFRILDHLWVDVGLGYVNGKLIDTNEYLPRIPPFHGRLRLGIPFGGWMVQPELVMAAEQDKVFRSETPTPGYAVLNLLGSYTFVRGHYAHVFSVVGYNLTNELYYNHTSFLKELMPEIGRGVKFSYALRFF